MLFTGLYALYGWVAVPVFLPPPDERHYAEVLSGNQENPSREEVAPYLPLLPEGEWERNPKIDLHYLQFGDTVILFSKDTIDGKYARLEPCTVLMIPGLTDSALTEKERQEKIQEGIVLRAPLYAEIEFDQDFNFGQIAAKTPNITGCKLYGKVTISSAMKPGADDDLYLETENISISESSALTRITTLKDVRFRYGGNSGSGSVLTMELTPQNPKNPKSPKELNRVQFEKLKQLQLIVKDEKNGEKNDDKPAVIDIHCQREFYFRREKTPQNWIASFLGNTEIVRTNPDGTQDNLDAEEVHLRFISSGKAVSPPVKGAAMPPLKTTAPPKAATALSTLQPTSFVAAGKPARSGQPAVPVILRSQQSDGVLMSGDRILYDIAKNFLAVETQTSKEVEIVLQNKYFIRTEKSFQYTLGKETDVIGVLSSPGKGTLRGNIGDEKMPKNIFLSWNALQIAPCPVSKEQVLIQLWSGISAEVQDFGKMTADKLDFWCKKEELPQKEKSLQNSSFIPDRAMVKDKVRFTNDKGLCSVNRMDIFFETVNTAGMTKQSRWTPKILTDDAPLPSDGRQINPIQQVQYTQPNSVQHTAPMLKPLTQRPAVVPLYQAQPERPVAASVKEPVTASPNVPVQRPFSVAQQNLLGMNGQSGAGYEITGEQMRMLVRNTAGQSNVETLVLEGGVVIEEKLTDNTKGGLVRITGNEVQVWNPSAPDTQIKISGDASRRAVFTGRGAELTAQEINVDRASNKIWSPGAGVLTANTANVKMPAAAGEQSVALVPMKQANSIQDSRLTVEWNQEMRFDGQRLQFLGKADRFGNRVKTLYQDKAVWCDIMEIHLNRFVSLFDDKSGIKPEAEVIQCANDVYIISEEYDENRKLKSKDSARFAKLRYQIASNTFVAEGPGVLRSMSLGSGKGFADSAIKIPGAVNAADAKQGKLNFLSVWFLNYVRGTFLGVQKNVDIQGRVQAVYCPADSWDDVIDIDNQSAARYKGYILECEQLQITELPDPAENGKPAAELTASGNAKIDGSKIYGSAQTIKYNQAKSTVMFDGKARIHTLEQGKKSEQSAEMIQYNIETGAVRLNQSQGITITR
jgi:lipopolysaccharide export system protein LptA